MDANEELGYAIPDCVGDNRRLDCVVTDRGLALSDLAMQESLRFINTYSEHCSQGECVPWTHEHWAWPGRRRQLDYVLVGGAQQATWQVAPDMQTTSSDHVLLAARIVGGVRRRRRALRRISHKGWWPADHCRAKVRRLLDAVPANATAAQLQTALERL
eukprot:11199871-Lingulodinium_polyedra.AAC.1